jgi:hydroxymethylglutaryl-CoA lyase
MNKEQAIQIVDVAPRDGFQAVKAPIPTVSKIEVSKALAAANFKRIEVGSFVSPKAIPQMADTKDVHAALSGLSDVRLSTLVPNAIGAKNAIEAGVSDLVFVLSASESHNQSNVKRSVSNSFGELEKIVDMGKCVEGFMLRFNIATVFDCPFEGRVLEQTVQDIIAQAVDLDFPIEFGLCDTTGRAFPDHVASFCSQVIEQYKSNKDIGWAFHGHDTYGLGVANALYAYDAGVRVFDAAAAGLGGCPFAPGASGNTASEDLVFTFENMGVATGIDLEKLLDVAALIDAFPDVDTGGHVRSLPRKRICG